MAPVSMSAALGTVVLERILDTVVIVTFALIIILSPSFPTGAVVAGLSVGSIVSGAAVVLALVLGLVVLAVFRRGAVMRVVRACLAVLPERAREAVAHRADALLSGLTMVRRPASLVRAMLWTVLLWLWMGSAFWTAFRAFGTPLGGFAPAMFTECSLSLFEVLPAGPGFIGTMQAGVLASVHTIYGVAADPALSMALGYFVAGFVPVTLIGLYYAWAVGLRIRSMGAAAETVLEAGGD
jgi:hypothetical protein